MVAAGGRVASSFEVCANAGSAKAAVAKATKAALLVDVRMKDFLCLGVAAASVLRP
jgi:hypothetical protein